jgi:peptidoglycan hydrolase CwlO-like protein
LGSNRALHVGLRIPFIGMILVCFVLAGVEALADPHSGPPSAHDRLETILGQMESAARNQDALQHQLAGLLEQLEQTSGAIERVQADIAATRTRIADVTRTIDLQQSKLDQQAANMFMSQPVEAVGSVLDTNSLTDFQDAIEFLDAVSRQDHDLIGALSNVRTEIERHRFDLERLRAKLDAERRRLRTRAGDVVRKLAEERALLRTLDRDKAEAEDLILGLSRGERRAARRRINDLDVQDPGLPPGPQEVKALIRRFFAPFGSWTQEIAICVADIESDFDPLAVNPSTGASGVFQFMPSTWSSKSRQAGLGSHSVFEARANVAVAAWTVGHDGWGAWGSSATHCGA